MAKMPAHRRKASQTPNLPSEPCECCGYITKGDIMRRHKTHEQIYGKYVQLIALQRSQIFDLLLPALRDLLAIYDHLDSGETGWSVPEALRLIEIRKMVA